MSQQSAGTQKSNPKKRKYADNINNQKNFNSSPQTSLPPAKKIRILKSNAKNSCNNKSTSNDIGKKEQKTPKPNQQLKTKIKTKTQGTHSRSQSKSTMKEKVKLSTKTSASNDNINSLQQYSKQKKQYPKKKSTNPKNASNRRQSIEKVRKRRKRKGFTLKAGNVIYWVTKHGSDGTTVDRSSIITKIWDYNGKRINKEPICFDYWPKYARSIPDWNTPIRLILDCEMQDYLFVDNNDNGKNSNSNSNDNNNIDSKYKNNNNAMNEYIKLKQCNFIPSSANILIPRSMKQFNDICIHYLNTLYSKHIIVENSTNSNERYALERDMQYLEKEIEIAFNLGVADRIADFFAFTDGLMSKIQVFDEKMGPGPNQISMKIDMGDKYNKQQFVPL